MNTKFKKYLYWSVSFTAIFIILFSFYYNMGGFDQIKTIDGGKMSYSIAGRQISGTRMEREEEAVFLEMKAHLATKALGGILCIVDYKDDTLKDGESRRFIGVLLEDEIASVPDDLSFVEFESEKVLMCALLMHPLVMPNSKIVEEKITSYATAQDLKLRKITLEKIFEDNSVIVEMFVE